MKFSEAREILTEALPLMQAALGLSAWVISSSCTSWVPEGTAADCVAQWKYSRAFLRFNPKVHADRAHLLRVLRHELLHIMHADFDLVWEMANDSIPLSVDLGLGAMKMFSQGFYHAQERTVWQLEAMLDALGMTPERLLEVGRERLGA